MQSQILRQLVPNTNTKRATKKKMVDSFYISCTQKTKARPLLSPFQKIIHVIRCTQNTKARPLLSPFQKIIHVRIALLMTSQRKDLIFNGALTFQMTIAKGTATPCRSACSRYLKAHLVSHSYIGRSLTPMFTDKCRRRSCSSSFLWPKCHLDSNRTP